jgi:hypothetical protein
MIIKSLGLAAVSAVALVLPAFAHHSHSMYDSQKRITLNGTVVEFHWVNPHTWLYMTVADATGKEVEWVLEGGGPGTLTRRGWSGTMFKPGDKITATVMPMKDGTHGALLGTIELNGEVFDGD